MALTAQGFGLRKPSTVTMRHLQSTIDQVAQFQVDSVNVVARAQYLPVFSRWGEYDTSLLDRAVGNAPRRLFEYWGHAASMIDVRLEPALRTRMARAEDEAWGNMRVVAQEHPELVARVLDEIAVRPRTARQIESAVVTGMQPEPSARDAWGWNWSQVKTATEWLFWSGQLSVAARTPSFERLFDLPANVLPPEVVHLPTPTPSDAVLALVRRSASALAVATLGCLTDYFRLNRREVASAIAELEASGELIPVRVDGWARDVWVWHKATRPRQLAATALLSPFDSLVFERRRLRELFGFDYRIEIYVPAKKRQFGYYVYPFLMKGRFVARVDLKADRDAGFLIVRSVWLEEGIDPEAVRDSLRLELERMAGWLGLSGVRVLPLSESGVQGNGRPLKV